MENKKKKEGGGRDHGREKGKEKMKGEKVQGEVEKEE